MAVGATWDEIDLAVLDGPANSVPWEKPVLYRTSKGESSDRVDGEAYGRQLSAHSTDAVEIHVPDLEPESLRHQAEQLETSYPRGHRYPHFVSIGIVWSRSFLTNQRDENLAGEYFRGGDAPAWVLPSHAPNMQMWLRLFLQRVHDADPSLVPDPPPSWSAWETAEQQQLREKRSVVYTEASARLAEYQKQLDDIDEQLAQAQQAADAGLGRLLTADGDELKDAVAQALRGIGFEVMDADEQLEPGLGKREDLWVSQEPLPEPSDITIAEVKGYSRGAKSSDVVEAATYAALYVERHGVRPAGQWHVVNPFRGQDPSTRPAPFEGHDDVIAAFGGLVLDTRDLFRLVRDAQLGKTAAHTARRRLLEAEPGLFSYP